MRRGRRPPVLVLCALAAAGCGSGPQRGLPAACQSDSNQVVRALARAPGRVRLGETRLSECLRRGSRGQDVQRIGTVYVEAAATLATRARRDPNGPAAVQLGYLVGAVERGAASTEGVHSELVRRLDQELAPLRGRAAARRGRRAGRASG